VAPRDVDALRDALRGLLNDPARRARMGTAARARAVTEFSYDHLVERLGPVARGELGSLQPLDIG
jgi:glycosyltransferase involved in cell wall biosynthesis